MQTDDGEAIFKLWVQLKNSTEMARDARLGDIESILRLTADLLVQKYHSLGLPANRDIHTLIWELEKWPASTATFMEMKSLLLQAKGLSEQADSYPAAKSEK